MKILITGGAGYLGSVLTEQLLGRGHKVTVLDRFDHRCLSLAHLCNNLDLTIRHADAYDEQHLHIPDHDVLIPLAAVVGADACKANPTEALRINKIAVEAMCKLARPDQIIIIPNTNSGYGVGSEAECTEESPLNPISLYGRLKVEAERTVMQRSNSVSLRLATLFGWSPRMRRDLLVNDLVWRAMQDRTAVIYEGHFRRNFCHVRDAARAFCFVIGNWANMRGEVYNVGDTRANMTKLDLCGRIADHAKFNYVLGPHGRDPDQRDYIVSNAKLEGKGWQPKHTLDDGIEELLSGYKMMRKNDYGNY